METLQSNQLQKFLKSFENTHGTMIPQYLKYLLDFCDYSEFTIRFFDENSVKELENFVRDELSKSATKEDWNRLTGGKFKDQHRFVFFPPIKLILLELAKFANNKHYRTLCKPEVISEHLVENCPEPIEENTTNIKRQYLSDEEAEPSDASNNLTIKRQKIDKVSNSQEGLFNV